MTRILILVDDQPAETATMAAARHGLTPDAMRHAIIYAGVRPIALLDPRRPLYLVSDTDAMMTNRPSRRRWIDSGSGPGYTPAD